MDKSISNNKKAFLYSTITVICTFILGGIIFVIAPEKSNPPASILFILLNLIPMIMAFIFMYQSKEVCGLCHIHDYYGMVEQTGCIYMECECGHLHASNFSDIIIRRPIDFSEANIGEDGIIQVVSTIPESYPGHSLLTEDEGRILGIDDCPCGRKGKYFKIHGRLKNAEIRGCRDTYADKFKT